MTKAALNDGPESGTRTKTAIVRIGRIADITAEGEVWIRVGEEAPQLARTLSQIPLAALHQALREETPVAVTYPDDASAPIVTGILRARREDEEGQPLPNLVMQATESIVFECGKALIRLEKSGRITVQGLDAVDVTSDGNVVIAASTIRLN